jgi:hypothetical protein
VSFPTDYTLHDHNFKSFTPLRVSSHKSSKTWPRKRWLARVATKTQQQLAPQTCLSNQIFNQDPINSEPGATSQCTRLFNSACRRNKTSYIDNSTIRALEGLGFNRKLITRKDLRKWVSCWSERDVGEVIAGTIPEEMVHTLQHCCSVLSLHQRPLACLLQIIICSLCSRHYRFILTFSCTHWKAHCITTNTKIE